jgi:hypothetical protein
MLGGLALYGRYAWYFPNAAFATVAAILAATFGIAGAYRLQLWVIAGAYRRRPSISTLAFLLAFLSGITFVALILWSAFVQGLPAVVTYLLGGNGTEVAVIGAKKKSQNSRYSCDYQLGLVGYKSVLKDTLCVDSALWNHAVVGQRVEILVRKDILGTRIFDIRLPPKS